MNISEQDGSEYFQRADVVSDLLPQLQQIKE